MPNEEQPHKRTLKIKELFLCRMAQRWQRGKKYRLLNISFPGSISREVQPLSSTKISRHASYFEHCSYVEPARSHVALMHLEDEVGLRPLLPLVSFPTKPNLSEALNCLAGNVNLFYVTLVLFPHVLGYFM